MKTITIQIGNTDDKLSQHSWSHYVDDMWNAIMIGTEKIHFSGGSKCNAPWQNYAWVVEVGDVGGSELRHAVAKIGRQYDQDSIAWTVGETEFV